MDSLKGLKECWNAMQESSRKQKEKLKRRCKKSSEGIMGKVYLMWKTIEISEQK
jgi:hypothetical protein